MPHYSVSKAAVLSLSRLVADTYAGDGIRCNAVTPGPTATEAWLGEGGLADQQGGDRDEVLAKVGARPAARPARRAGGDRRGDRLPRLRARLVRHRRRVERGRRHRPDHHLPEGAIVEWRSGGEWIAPLHIHHADDEAWYVLDGSLRFLLTARPRRAGRDDDLRAKVRPRYGNPSPTRPLSVVMTPKIERLIERLHEATGGHPRALREYDSELLPRRAVLTATTLR